MFRRILTFISRSALLVTLACGFLTQARAAEQSAPPQGQELKPILAYIATAWDTLTHSVTDCKSLVDPKMQEAAVLYLPAGMAEPEAVRKLSGECKVQVEHLPIEIHHLGEIDTSKIQPQGLLYLENKYVVPGGRFNEMYGWDSYFIIRGLLRAGRVELARGMVENFFFQV
jgi:alpha,alpha-trehalase